MNVKRLISAPIPAPRPSRRKGSGRIFTGFRQRGVTLLMSLIFLLLLTILGVTAMNTSTLQEKMAGNLRDQNVALQAAESAIRGCEIAVNLFWVGGRPSPISVTNCPSSDPTCAWQTGTTRPTDEAWWAEYRKEYGVTGTKELIEANADPYCVIEHAQNILDSGHRGDRFSPPPGMDFYRITARAVGTTPLSQSMLESTFKIRY